MDRKVQVLVHHLGPPWSEDCLKLYITTIIQVSERKIYLHSYLSWSLAGPERVSSKVDSLPKEGVELTSLLPGELRNLRVDKVISKRYVISIGWLVSLSLPCPPHPGLDLLLRLLYK